MATQGTFLVFTDDVASLTATVKDVSPWGNVEGQDGSWDDGEPFNTAIDVDPDEVNAVQQVLETLGLRYEYLGLS